MDERPNWAEIHAQLKSARETLSADERRRQPSRTVPIPSATAEVKFPDTSPDFQARLEARARQRRIEHCSAAALSAMQRGQFVEARAAVAEIQELDPSHPEIVSLGLAFDEAEFRATTLKGAPLKGKTRRKKGPALAAAAVFAIGLLAASQLGSPDLILRPLAAVQFAGISNLVTYGAQTLSLFTGDDAVETTAVEPAVPPSPPARPAAPVPRFDETPPVVPEAPAVIAPPPVASALLPPVAFPPPVVAPPPPVSVPVETAPPTPLAPPEPEPVLVTVVDSERSIRQALERYRAAYEKLDARSAQQVWPGVDEPALARAFTGLRSQALMFDDCKVRISGAVATASCSGHMRYVPKVGSQQPRIESRVWDFTLRQAGGDWKIESARVDR